MAPNTRRGGNHNSNPNGENGHSNHNQGPYQPNSNQNMGYQGAGSSGHQPYLMLPVELVTALTGVAQTLQAQTQLAQIQTGSNPKSWTKGNSIIL